MILFFGEKCPADLKFCPKLTTGFDFSDQMHSGWLFDVTLKGAYDQAYYWRRFERGTAIVFVCSIPDDVRVRPVVISATEKFLTQKVILPPEHFDSLKIVEALPCSLLHDEICCAPKNYKLADFQEYLADELPSYLRRNKARSADSEDKAIG